MTSPADPPGGAGVPAAPGGRAAACLFGLAYGDAMGKPTEFLPYQEIETAFRPDGPRELPPGDPVLVTDDTQMTLCVAESLAAALGDAPHARLTPAPFEAALRRSFIAWAASPENNRAPGMTCLRAVGGLADGLPWTRATIAGSKGCGANMRVAPVGLVPGLPNRTRAAAAQFQAALTHGHPTALAASELTAFAVHWLATGLDPDDLLPRLIEHCETQRTVYYADWLDGLWQRPGATTPEDFIARGWDECRAALDRVAAALPDAARWRRTDPCPATGAGWIAEEALATGLFCFLLFRDDPVAALGRAAASSGDSDSLACLAGAFAGAAQGPDAWPAPWRTRIEYSARLSRFGALWDSWDSWDSPGSLPGV